MLSHTISTPICFFSTSNAIISVRVLKINVLPYASLQFILITTSSTVKPGNLPRNFKPRQFNNNCFILKYRIYTRFACILQIAPRYSNQSAESQSYYSQVSNKSNANELRFSSGSQVFEREPYPFHFTRHSTKMINEVDFNVINRLHESNSAADRTNRSNLPCLYGFASKSHVPPHNRARRFLHLLII